MQFIARLAAITVLAIAPSAVKAADVKISSTTGMNAVMSQLVGGFEKATSHKVVLAPPAIANEIAKRIQSGEVYDVAIVTRELASELIKSGKAASGTNADIARIAIGAAVRAGHPKPNIATADAFKDAVMKAKSITYTRGLSGVHFEALLTRWGIADQVKAKSKIVGGGEAIPAVARGEAEIGIDIEPQIVSVPGVDLAGRLPEDLQNYVILTAVISSASGDAGAARAFIDFVRSGPSGQLLQSKGMEALK